MKVNRLTQLQPYDAPGHTDMRCLRVQGHEASPSRTSWMGMSVLLPGGHTTLTPSPLEKMYLVLEGEVHLTNGTESVRLAKHDSVYFEPHESRQLRNDTNTPATILLVMPYAVKHWE